MAKTGNLRGGFDTFRRPRLIWRLAIAVALGLVVGAPVCAEMFVTSGGSAAGIAVFADGAAAAAAPLRTIAGPNTTLDLPGLVAVDRVHAEILVPDYLTDRIAVFPIEASGNVAPSRVIAGPATGLFGPSALVLDLAHDEIIVVCTGDFVHGSLLSFPRSACSGLCVNNGRFEVSATFRTSTGETGTATGVALTGDTGFLWFFEAANVEVVVKVVDGCSLGGHYWVFAGGLTDVEVKLTVTDTATGQSKSYANPLNVAFKPIQDTSAFATCP